MKVKPTRKPVGKALKQPRFNDEAWPRPVPPSSPSRQVEMLARMWIACDPNRGVDEPDDPIETDGGSSLDGKPRWHWFIPRAEASLAFFKANGFALRTSQDKGEPNNG